MVKAEMGLLLKEAREAKGLSLREAGAESRIEFKSIYGYENGIEPGFGYAVILCDLYGMPIEVLAGVVSKNPWRPPRVRRYGKSMKKSTMGGLFREARKARQLTTREAAAGSRINYVSITRYEHDRSEPRFSAAVILCDFYGIDVQVLADIVRGNYRTKPNTRQRAKKPEQGKKTRYLCKE